MPRHWRVTPHGSLTPGRAPCRASDTCEALTTVQACGAPGARLLCRLRTPPLGSGRLTPPSATVRGTPHPAAPGEASRGKLSYRPCRDARYIQHRPLVEGGLCGRVPARPDGTTPRIGFVFLARPIRSTLPSDASSRSRPEGGSRSPAGHDSRPDPTPVRDEKRTSGAPQHDWRTPVRQPP